MKLTFHVRNSSNYSRTTFSKAIVCIRAFLRSGGGRPAFTIDHGLARWPIEVYKHVFACNDYGLLQNRLWYPFIVFLRHFMLEIQGKLLYQKV